MAKSEVRRSIEAVITMSESVWRLPDEGACVAVLANCHVTEGATAFPQALFPRLQEADLIVTLGRVGDHAALDRLEEIAPVLGVAAPGDPDDIRTRRSVLVLGGEGYHIGCVADAVTAGLAQENFPFVATSNAEVIAARLFGGPVDILLHAGAAVAEEGRFGQRRFALNPGSPTVSTAAGRPSFLRLKVTQTGCYGQFVWVA